MLLVILLPLLGACADLAYFRQAAVGHLTLLWNARPVDAVMSDVATPEKLKVQLQAARDIRRFASDVMQLPDNRSYTRYVDTGQRFAVWNVLATEELSLKLVTHCFPFTGCVSYKGFYSEADARQFAAGLREKGLEATVAGVPAYSTLGWTPDPLLNTFIHYPQGELARLIFHELAHQVLYIADDTTFNESFASAVEEIGVELWLEQQGNPAITAEYRQFDARRKDFQRMLMQTRQQLEQAFGADIPRQEKQASRDRIFEGLQQQYRQLREGPWQDFAGYDRFFREELNAPRLAGFGLYRQWVPALRSLFVNNGRDFARFYAAAAELGKLDRSAREQRLSAMENPELATAVLLPDLVVGQGAGGNHRDPVIRTGHLREID